METGQFGRQTADITQNPGGVTYAAVKPKMSVWREQNCNAATEGLWFTSNFRLGPITHSIDHSELWTNGPPDLTKKWTHFRWVWELYYSSLVPRHTFVIVTVVYLISEKTLSCAKNSSGHQVWNVRASTRRKGLDGKTKKCASFGRNSC